ncbi:uncharacterized protein LOC111086661 [Limulus polyphemus]|uniref:Uncharacterized protein LOC111086661 n=1 Tax=Limulus polyphemus TaxID=6850 RepID=A0ABM1SR78_LIMPO|nr:uncharacterized protein LOC111086661 [Limulus polyphemus]
MKTLPCTCKKEPNGNVPCHHSYGCHGDEPPDTQYSCDMQPATENESPETTASNLPEPESNHNQSQTPQRTLSDGATKDREGEEASQSDRSFLQDSGGYQWCLDDECDKELNLSLIMDQNITTISPDQDSLNYDQISLHLDASLAEIDMETFRSEDINSLLSLPGVCSIGSDEEVLSLVENCTTASHTFANGFELERSVSSHSLSEEESAEGFISKDEPLFSPAKEPLNANNTSVDSIDYTSLDEQNIAVTCQANKSNYTIAFEGSGTQLSDDSDVALEMKQNKDKVPRPITGCHQSKKMTYNSTVQHDLSYTTWGKVKNYKQLIRPALYAKPQRSRSKSLPSLFKRSLVLTDKQFGEWGFKINPVKRVPVYELHSSCYGSLQGSDARDNKHSVPLFKLFIKSKTSLGSASSSWSGSVESMLSYPAIHSNENTIDNDEKNVRKARGVRGVKAHNLQFEKTRDKYISGPLHLNQVSNCNNQETEIKVSKNLRKRPSQPTTHVQNVHELNNNLIQTFLNNNTSAADKDMPKNINRKQSSSESDDSSSQYFEDSLVDGPLIQHTPTHSSTIKEEENEQLDTDSVNGDETMRDSKDPFGSDNSTSEEGTITKNNAMQHIPEATKYVEEFNTVKRINNYFRGGKTEKKLINNMCVTHESNKLLEKFIKLVPENSSQGTQTKTLNSSEKLPEYFYSEGNSSQSIPSLEEMLNNSRQSRRCKETSPFSSGYSGNRQTSIEKLHYKSQLFVNNNCASPVLKRNTNVKIVTTRSRGTQIPVHIKDQAIQTSLISTNSNLGSFNVQETYTDSSGDKTGELFPSPLSSINSKFSNTSSGTSSEKKPVYVCYPSYSLPDLSFLKNLRRTPEGKDLLSTESTDNLPATQTEDHSNRHSNDEKERPVSDRESVEMVTPQKFRHIRDWDSLSVLLPSELKSAIPSYQTKTSDDDHKLKDDKGFHCRCSSENNQCCAEHNKSQNHQERDFSYPGESFSSTTSSSRDSEHPYSDNTLRRQRGAAGTPSELPKRSISLPFEKAYSERSQSGNSSRRGILRKSLSIDHCNQKKGHERPDVANRGIASQLDFHGRNKFDHYTQSLENIPEKIPQIESEMYSDKYRETVQHLQKESYTDRKSVEITSNNDPKTTSESSEKQGFVNPVAETFSGGHCPKGHSFQILSPAPCQDTTKLKYTGVTSCFLKHSNNLNIDQNYPCGNHCCSCSLNSIKSPINQLCDQLQQLLNSSTSLNLMAAALLATKESTNEINSCSFSSDCSGSRVKKSVTFHDDNLAVEANDGVTKENIVCNKEVPRDEPISDEDSESPPEEFVVSPQQGSSMTFPPSGLNNTPRLASAMALKLKQKTGLLKNVTMAVDLLLSHGEEQGNQKQKVLKYLCPALYNVLENGLLSSDNGPNFVANSPWKVAESSSQFGHPTKELQDLVKYIAGKNDMVGNTCRFYMFVLGLLNLGLVDWWFLHVTSCEPLIRQHYQPDALLSLLASPLSTNLCEILLTKLRPLAALPFALDLKVRNRDIRQTDNESPTAIIHTTEQKPLPIFMTPNITRIPPFETGSYNCALTEEPKASSLRRSRKTSEVGGLKTEFMDDKLSNVPSLKVDNQNHNVFSRKGSAAINEISKLKDLEHRHKLDNENSIESFKHILPFHSRGYIIDEHSEKRLTTALNTDPAKELFQRAVNLAFPSTKSHETESQKLQNTAGDKNSNNIIQGSDLSLRNIQVNRQNNQDCMDKHLENCNKVAQTQKIDEMGNCFEELKRKWEQMSSTPRSVTPVHTTKVTTMPKQPPVFPPSLTHQDLKKSKAPTRMPQQTTLPIKVIDSLSPDSHVSSPSQTPSSQQPLSVASSTFKELILKEQREDLLKQTVKKSMPRTSRGPKHPTVKQVANSNETLNTSVKQQNVASAPSSPSRKPHQKRSLDKNISSGSSSPSSTGRKNNCKSDSGTTGPKSFQARKSFIPIQRASRSSPKQQRKKSQNTVPCSSRS